MTDTLQNSTTEINPTNQTGKPSTTDLLGALKELASSRKKQKATEAALARATTAAAAAVVAVDAAISALRTAGLTASDLRELGIETNSRAGKIGGAGAAPDGTSAAVEPGEG